MKRLPHTLILACAITLAWAPSLSAAETTATTNGSFFMQVAAAAGLPAGDAATAMGSLNGTGIDLTSFAPGAPLTEAGLVAFGSAVGLQVTTASPQAAVGADAAARFVSVFRSDIVRAIGGDETAAPESHPGHPQSRGADPLTKGKGKKKGLLKSPSRPG